MYYLKLLIYSAITAALLCPRSAHGHLPDSIKNLTKERAAIHAGKLLALQRKTNHLWKGSGWWNSANVFESVLDYHMFTSKDFSKEIRTIYRRNVFTLGRIRFISPNAFDDDEWWALAWLKAYDMTGDKKYMAISDGIFRHMVRRSWTNVCGGGLNWQRFNHYKNSVTNELFLTLAARLALETKDSVKKQYYLNWAMKEWNWFKNSKMYNDTSWIADGLNKDCSCKDEGQLGSTFTYTQGVILGGLKYLYELTADDQYLAEARKIAHTSMKNFVNKNGVVTDHDDGPANHDMVQFKGIYIRYLALINTELHDEAITDFILRNADHVWQCSRSSDGLCDYNWNGPYKRSNYSGAAQGSTMDLMNAAMMQR